MKVRFEYWLGLLFKQQTLYGYEVRFTVGL